MKADYDYEQYERLEKLDDYLERGGDDYDVPEPGICPECGEQTLFPNGSEIEFTDRDGRRGVRVFYNICAECGYEGEAKE